METMQPCGLCREGCFEGQTCAQCDVTAIENMNADSRGRVGVVRFPREGGKKVGSHLLRDEIRRETDGHKDGPLVTQLPQGNKKVFFLFELLIKRSVFPMGRLKSSLI